MKLYISQNPQVQKMQLPQNSSQSFAGDVQEYQSEDNSKLKTGAVVGLALAAAAGIYFISKKPQKVADIISNATDNVANAVGKAADDTPTPAIPKKKKYKITRNLTKEQKRVVKREAQVVRDAKLAEQINSEKTLLHSRQVATSSSSKVKSSRQGLQNKKSVDAVNQIVETSAKNLQQVEENAKIARETASELGTSRARKEATRATNALHQAELSHKKTVQKATAKAEELRVLNAQKAKAIKTQQNSPNYETGQLKQMFNADKTTENALWKGYWGIKAKKGQSTGKEFLQKVIDNPRESEAKKALAKKWLADLKEGKVPSRTQSVPVATKAEDVIIPEVIMEPDLPKAFVQKPSLDVINAEVVDGVPKSPKIANNVTKQPKNVTNSSKVEKTVAKTVEQPKNTVNTPKTEVIADKVAEQPKNVSTQSEYYTEPSVNKSVQDGLDELNEFKSTDYSFKPSGDYCSKGLYGQDINDITNPLNKMDPSSPYYNPYENNLTNNYTNSYGTSMNDYSTGVGYNPFGF